MRPKKVKFLKQHRYKRKLSCNNTKGTMVHFGSYGFKSLEVGYVTENQIEAARKVISRSLKDVGKLWIRVFPDLPITKKPIEVRQGKGCGSVDHWVVPVNCGRVLFEVSGVSYKQAKEICRVVSSKLSVKVFLCSSVF